MQALILAGGEGTSLRPLTVYTPKPVMPIANRPFLFYQIDLLKRAGIKDISLALVYQPNKIDDIFGNGLEYGVNLHYVVETVSLGTAGAYKNATRDSDQPTIVFNGDIISDVNLRDVIAFHQSRKAVATIMLTPVENPSTFGVVETDDEGRVLRFLEKPSPEETTSKMINAGIYILEPEVLNYIASGEKFSFEYQLFPALLAAKAPFFAYTFSGYWADIGTPQRYLQTNLDLLKGRVKSVKLERPKFNYTGGENDPPQIDKLSLVDQSCTIKSGAVIINSVIGPNCFIEDRTRIENSVLLAGARVGKASEIRNSILGKSAIIGRYSKIENAVLGDKSALTDYSLA